MFKNFIFDMDGTLIDSKQMLKNGVVEMFECLKNNVTHANFAIASGARLNQIERVCEEINSRLTSKINFNKISNCGACINHNGINEYRELTNEIMAEIICICKTVDKDSIIVCRGKEIDYATLPQSTEGQEFFHEVDNIARQFGIITQAVSESEFSSRIQQNDVLSVEIISKKKQNEIYKNLQSIIENHGLYVALGYAIEISTLGKVAAIEKLFMLQNRDNQDNSFENTVYMGDGYNDVEVFERAKLSFGIGDNLFVLKHATYAIDNYKQATDFLFSSDKDSLKISSVQKLENLGRALIK